jgi:hypothetical protein
MRNDRQHRPAGLYSILVVASPTVTFAQRRRRIGSDDRSIG